MERPLTKPQRLMLWKAMKRGDVCVHGAQWRTANNLADRGLLEHRGDTQFDICLPGLKALRDYWMRKDAASGCIAYQQNRATVEAAIAEAEGR